MTVDQSNRPSDWGDSIILDGVSLLMDYRGRTPKKLGMSWGGGTVRAISARNVKMNRIDFTEECYLGSMKLYRRWMGAGDMASGDVLFTTEAPLGNVAAVPDTQKYILSQRTVLLRPNPALFDSVFFLKYLQGPSFQRAILDNATGSTALGIQRRRLERLVINRPPLAEQRAIGGILQDQDDLIGRLDGLVAKKQAIKRGMMQQLLTGRARLPGFNTTWTEATIGELASVDPETLSSGTHPGTWIDYISLEDVNRGQLFGSSHLAFAAAPSRARRIVRAGDVLFGTVRPNLQSHLLYSGGLPNPIASTGFGVLRSNEDADPAFIFNLLMSDLAAIQIDRIIAGSNYPAVSSGDVRRLVFGVPSILEQRAIAEVLTDAEQEITALQARLDKANAIKQGMMQELLTGRTRLPAEVSS